MELLWIRKTAQSTSLSHSEHSERIQVFSQAQRTSRLLKPGNSDRRKLTKAKHKEEKRSHANTTEVAATSHEKVQIQYELGLDPDWSPGERRAIEFYLDVTVKKMLAEQQDMLFWRDDVLCLTRLYPAFRHLTVAIAATHEMLFADDATRLNSFALEQCNKATKLLRILSGEDTALLVASCALISAYNLLRCDLENADKTSEAGLRMASELEQSRHGFQSSPTKHWRDRDFLQIFAPLNFRGGYKLWAPDVNFQFEKIPVADNLMVIEIDCVKGPFVNSEMALESYKSIAAVVANVLRNLAVGAFVDPSSALSQQISRQLGLFQFYWDMNYTSLRQEDVTRKLEMLSLRVAFYDIYLLFHSRVICPDELQADRNTHFLEIRRKVLDISEEVLGARNAGVDMTYVDRFVTRTLCALGLYSFDDGIRRRTARLLQSQIQYSNGLVNWLMGAILTMIADVQQQRIDAHDGEEIVTTRRLILLGYHYREHDNKIVMEYANNTIDGRVEQNEEHHVLDPEVGAKSTPHDIDDALQTIMASYKMFGKPSLAQNPRGFARPMYFGGRLVHVCFGSNK